MSEIERLENDLERARAQLAALTDEAEKIDLRVMEAALSEDEEAFVGAQMRKVTLPLWLNRVALLVVETELELVRKRKEPAVEELEAAVAQAAELQRSVFLRRDSPNLRDAYFRVDAAKEKVDPLETRERELIAQQQELKESGKAWSAIEVEK